MSVDQTITVQTLLARIEALERLAVPRMVAVDKVIKTESPFKRFIDTDGAGADFRIVFQRLSNQTSNYSYILFERNTGTEAEPSWDSGTHEYFWAVCVDTGGMTLWAPPVCVKSGAQAFQNSETSTNVVVDPPEPDAYYNVLVSTEQGGYSGSPPPVDVVAQVSDKATDGFTLTLSQQPGSGATLWVAWWLFRIPMPQ